MVLAGNPGGILSAMGILNSLAQRSRSLPIHSPLSVKKHLDLTDRGVKAKPTFDLKRWPIARCIHDPTQENRDISDIAFLEHGRCLLDKGALAFVESRSSTTFPSDVCNRTVNNRWNPQIDKTEPK